MAGRITGRVEILVNNQLLLNKAGATAEGIGISGEQNFELEQIVGDTGGHGYVERPVSARCVVTITDRSDISISDLMRVREDGTVIFRAAGGGKVYIMEGATCLRNSTLTAGDGEIQLTYEAPFWTETTESS